jgi:hypothetical protein
MMRNVALGAVLGFGLMVVLLSVFGKDTPAAPVADAVVDAGTPARRLMPEGLHSVARPMVPLARIPMLQRQNPPDAGT